MNIFIYDLDHKTNAIYHPDRHVVKMQLELAQILSTNYRLLTEYEGDKVYKQTHTNHPSTIWCRESYSNFRYVLDLYYALHNEWNDRYGHDKIHKSFEIVSFIEDNLDNIKFKNYNLTPFALAMPDKYKNKNPVKAYKDYFNGEKLHLAQWKNKSCPDWVILT